MLSYHAELKTFGMPTDVTEAQTEEVPSEETPSEDMPIEEPSEETQMITNRRAL